MAQILFKVIPLPLWCVLPCVCLISSEATLLDFGRMTGVLRTSDKSAFSICPPTLMMPSLSRNGFSFLNSLFFLVQCMTTIMGICLNVLETLFLKGKHLFAIALLSLLQIPLSQQHWVLHQQSCQLAYFKFSEEVRNLNQF